MNTQQLALLIEELNNIALELLDVDLDLSEKDLETGKRVANVTGRLLAVNLVLEEHLDNQKIES